jgi:hypothetical protein
LAGFGIIKVINEYEITLPTGIKINIQIVLAVSSNRS